MTESEERILDLVKRLVNGGKMVVYGRFATSVGIGRCVSCCEEIPRRHPVIVTSEGDFAHRDCGREGGLR